MQRFLRKHDLLPREIPLLRCTVPIEMMGQIDIIGLIGASWGFYFAFIESLRTAEAKSCGRMDTGPVINSGMLYERNNSRWYSG